MLGEGRRAAVYYDRSPQSVYVPYPGVKAQIEVYDPDMKQALRLVGFGADIASADPERPLPTLCARPCRDRGKI